MNAGEPALRISRPNTGKCTDLKYTGKKVLPLKRFLSALLVLCLLAGSLPAFALTGEEALGLSDSSENTGIMGGGSSYPTLRLGSRDGDDAGAYVVMLQNRLMELGYLSSAADGQFGAMTESAVILFQENNDLTPTGVADDSTQSVLYSAGAKTAPVKAVVDNEAMLVQQMLIRYGFMYGSADGIVGDATETGVAQFKDYIYGSNQAVYAAYATPTPVPEATLAPDAQPIAMDIPIDAGKNDVNGQNGEITQEIIKFATGEYSFRPYQITLQRGSGGPEVWRVQRRLRQLKYLYNPDGDYGSLSEYAVKYFQRKNGLPETGVADQATQELLFSERALAAEEYVFPYKVYVSIDKQRVYIYAWDGAGYNEEIKSFKCSTGMEGYDTPTGIYQSGGRVTYGEWYYFADYNCYAKYAYRIVGGILFHSVLYNSSKKGPTSSSVRALGRKASHGCIRLAEENAQWIHANCPVGTTIVIQ